MKRHVVLRTIGLIGLYAAVFVALVLIQYVRRTAFTLNLGSLVISGNYRDAGAIKKQAKEEPYLTEGRLSVFFGGMEFRMAEEDGFSVTKTNGTKHPLSGLSFTLLDNAVQVALSDGSTLLFKTFYANGVETLSIQASLEGSSQDIRLPFRPLRSSHVMSGEQNRYMVSAGGKNYLFTGSSVDYQNKLISLKKGMSMAAYGMMPEKKGFNPSDLVIASALDSQAYTAAISRWQAQASATWERNMAGSPDEDTVLAYVSQAARKGSYRSATGTTPVVFLEGNQRTYRSSAFFGRLDIALRGLVSADREYLGRLSRMINEKNQDILAEPDLVRNLSIRGSKALVDDLMNMVKTMDPSTISPATALGVIENFVSWKKYRGSDENPFERLKEQALFVLSGTLKSSSDGLVLAFPAAQGDVAYSIRLGNAFVLYGTSAGLADWTALGRTLILSVLSLADSSGSVPALVDLSKDSKSFVVAGETRISASRMYSQITGDLYYPRIEQIAVSGYPGLWAWTGAGALSATFDGSVLDITVPFYEGETHYMMIKGVKPFRKIQLYSIDFRTDPRFERYDSSGWAYSESEQTLLLKMKHRAQEEHIRIFYQTAEQ
ncbi:hypothetical protein [Gracilinema caldarium]|uniref:hypothetical protein n=1 Tax=Gracilinema caldarium TaxID=215591 RepID=UPI0026F1EE19|nr:hypothetical protein [Gracilinema caldarium]